MLGTMKVLVLNAGSSSLKFALTETETKRHLLRGQVERIGRPEATLRLPEGTAAIEAPDHEVALRVILERLDLDQVDAIGHRVVHGGELTQSQIIDEALIERVRALIPLAPLHNPANLKGIEAARTLLPDLPQVAVFDTAFHQSMPEYAYLYALPERARRGGLRRYGFHGTSHHYVAQRAAAVLEKPLKALKLIILHLGNGASASAVSGGKSVDTSMGFTPLEGLIMGTRPGDLDPGVVLALVRQFGLEETEHMLSHESGLFGLSGLSHDLRDLHAAAERGDPKASLALSAYTYRIRKYVGAYAAAMGGLDALVFTAGVGENDPMVRASVLEGLAFLGFLLDPEKNAENATFITRKDSPRAALVIPTDEELAIALETARVLSQAA